MKNCKFEKNGGIAKIILARPNQKNPLNRYFPGEMNEILDEIESDETIKAIILTGEGDAFCSGGDVKEAMTPDEMELIQERNMVRDFIRVPLRMRTIDKPIISAVNGVCVGGGVALALASDMIIASEQAKFYFAFVKIGLSAADMGVTYFLQRNVGYAKAAELLLLGDVITAEEAEGIGMINKVVPHNSLISTAEQWAERIMDGPPVGISLTKFALNREQGMDMTTALEYQTYIQGYAMRTRDHKEAVSSFINKRNPHFLGK
jgi:2-(1,2-epoxy-1,2-dihydrophenyl)acetyl-CoA isomerase